ncbi:helicase [Puccinia graminis f. sp. tritici]|uniref:Helicase n=1 Tax=Puccinia graminis f. sp. tritici TaxID=56615 RepID=A0A5B0P4B2_PUCGR|nr:helicase [Puccinia graminis f. sp. tritici]KAA1094958.1 helicase [Puccinia graminis f. sp. tritici]
MTMNVKSVSSGSNGTQSEAYFTCLWRKLQTRKNKTWEGDGILCIRGSSCYIKSRDDGSQVASGQWVVDRDCVPGKIYMIGGKEVEIDQPISPQELEQEAKSNRWDHSVTSALPAQPHVTKTKVVSKVTPKVDLKFKPPMRLNTLNRPSNLTQVDQSKYFAKPTAGQPFNAPSTLLSSGLKRTKVESLSHGEIDTLTTGKEPKRFKPLLLKTLDSSPGVKPISQEVHQDRAFVCLYRKLKASKNSTWDGDGILCIERSQRGPIAVLKDSTNRKVLGSTLLGRNPSLENGSVIQVGSREAEIQRQATESESLDCESNSQETRKADWTDIVKNEAPVGSFKDPMLIKRTSHTGPKFDPQAEGALVLAKPSTAWLLKHDLQDAAIVDVVVDPSIARSLRPHQVDGLKFMYECTMGLREVGGHGCILADEMGLGKSIQAISLLWTLLRQNPISGQGPVIKRAMIVCPVTLVKNWKREIHKWLGRSRLNVFTADGKCDFKQFTCSLYYNVLVIGYEKLRTLSKEVNSIYPPIGLIIADEGHRLRSIEAKTTQALRSLKTKRRVVLSGTPIQNNLTEYYAMVDFVNPGILDDYRTFKKKFEQPILKSREPCCNPVQRSEGEARAEELAKMSRHYVLRRGSEVIQEHLPPRHDYCVFISPTTVQRNIYQAVLDSPETRAIFSGDISQHLVLMNTLKLLCNSPGLLMNEYSIKSLGQISSTLFPAWVTREDVQLSGKLIALAKFLDILKKKNNEKIILVSNFTKTLDIVESHCKASHYPFCRLDGKTAQNQRDNIVQVFNRSSASAQFIFLLSSKSGGVGLNLIGASRLILFDGDWNPATDLQAMARIWRQGQQKPCHIYRFLTTGTIDECIFQRQVTKIGLATDLMSAPKAGEETAGGGNTFTKSELKRVFELHSDTDCYTHDLLECQCLENKSIEEPEGWKEEDEREDPMACLDHSDSEGSLPDADISGFLPASKYKPSEKEDAFKLKRKLAELEKWVHVNATDPKSVDELEDEILNQTVSALNPNLSKKSEEHSQDDQTAKDGIITFIFTKSIG